MATERALRLLSRAGRIIPVVLIKRDHSISHCSRLRGSARQRPETIGEADDAARMHATNLNLAHRSFARRRVSPSSRCTTASDHSTCWPETARQRYRGLVETFELDVMEEDPTRHLATAIVYSLHNVCASTVSRFRKLGRSRTATSLSRSTTTPRPQLAVSSLNQLGDRCVRCSQCR